MKIPFINVSAYRRLDVFKLERRSKSPESIIPRILKWSAGDYSVRTSRGFPVEGDVCTMFNLWYIIRCWCNSPCDEEVISSKAIYRLIGRLSRIAIYHLLSYHTIERVVQKWIRDGFELNSPTLDHQLSQEWMYSWFVIEKIKSNFNV